MRLVIGNVPSPITGRHIGRKLIGRKLIGRDRRPEQMPVNYPFNGDSGVIVMAEHLRDGADDVLWHGNDPSSE